MYLIKKEIKCEVKNTIGNLEVSDAFQRIAQKAHEAIVFTDDMSDGDKAQQMETALYYILDLLGD